MQVASLRPELEFEVIKLVLLREKYLIRLKRVLDDSGGRVDHGIVGLFDTLREVTIATVEAIRYWEQSQVSYPAVKPFLWNSQNYLSKMVVDISYLRAYPEVEKWLEFTCDFNPFFVPPELLLSSKDVVIGEDAFVVFGKRPDSKQRKLKSEKKDKLRYLKSPYNTRIINDPDIFPSASVESRLNAIMKGKFSSSKLAEDVIKEDSNIYETFLSASLVRRVQICWKILCNVTIDLESQMSNIIAAANERDDFAGSTSGDPRNSATANSFDGDRISSAATSSFSLSQKQFRFSIRESASRQSQPHENESMRFTQLSSKYSNTMNLNSTVNVTGQSTFRGTSSTRLWTPHEIKLQKIIERRGTNKIIFC